LPVCQEQTALKSGRSDLVHIYLSAAVCAGFVENRFEWAAFQLAADRQDDRHDFEDDGCAKPGILNREGLFDRTAGWALNVCYRGTRFPARCLHQYSRDREALQKCGSDAFMRSEVPHGFLERAGQPEVPVLRYVEKNHVTVDVTARKVLSESIAHRPFPG